MDLQRETQSLKLELEERDKMLAAAHNDLSVLQKNAESQTDRMIRERMEQLFVDLGAPLAQAVTQDYLSSAQGKTIQPKDLLAVTRRFVGCLKSHGLELMGTIGEATDFDPKIHESLSLDEKIEQGERVTIRMVGLSFMGKILRRIAVSRELT